MKRRNIILISVLSFVGITSYAQSTQSISKDSSAIISWANGIAIQRGWVNIADTSVKVNGTNKASYGYPAAGLGKADSTSLGVVSLGDAGVATVTFDRPISNGNGPDFAVFENGLKEGTDSVYSELGFVEVSSDGNHFVRFPAVSKTQILKQVGSFNSLIPSNITNMAGDEIQGYGTPFDLDDIADSANIDLQNIRFVRVIDAVGDINTKYASYDSKGNIVNDPWPTPFASCGFDLDAVAAINTGQAYVVSDFESLSLSKDSYFTPAANDTVFRNGLALFRTAVTKYGIDAFTFSNMRNNTTAGYTNEYSAITKGGISAPDTGGTNYAIAYLDSYGTHPSITFSDKASHSVSGFYVTNATYPYLSMKNGDSYAKKFGGTTGNDPDWFALKVWGVKDNGKNTDTITYYLADFRSTDNTKDYIVNDWRWVDLSALGLVKSIQFAMNSSDTGIYGMNTPAYFCLDNLTVLPADAPVILPLKDIIVLKNSQVQLINLTQAFTAYDPTSLSIAVTTNTNESLVQTNLNRGDLSLSFTADQIGTATLTVTGTCNGKTVTNALKVTVVDKITGIAALSNDIKAYPNPCSSVLNVECIVGTVISILDVMGNTVAKTTAENAATQINTDNLVAGYYFLHITNNIESRTIKVLKK
jgi:hypothetical protein